MNKKHIAVLSTLYYPDMGAPSACIDKYVRALGDDYLFYIITRTDCVDFEPCNDYDIRYITSFRHRLTLKCRENVKRGHKAFLNKLVLGFINICKLIQTQYTFPSAQRWEVNQYAKQLEKLHSEVGIDVIFAVSNTAFPQLAALRFKKKHPNVKWLSFFYDPYSENYIYYKYKLFKRFWKHLNIKKEWEIYDKADFCLMTSELYKFVPTAFQVDKNKIFELLFPLNNLRINSTNNQMERHNECLLIFAGMFYKIIRNPEYMLSILSQVNSISFDMYVGKGECEDLINKYNKGNIHREEFVNHDRYVEMICNDYDVLVNVGNVSTLQAPSKMLELLSTGKPILNFYFTKDSQYEMIEKYPLGLNIGYQEVGAIEKVEQFCHEVKGKAIPYEEVEQLFPENKLETQVKLLKQLIEA